jgi:hypothetical protein
VIDTSDVTVRSAGWSDCDAYARHVSDDGKETVVVCSLGRHAAPGDMTEYHFDPDLEIVWRYPDEWLSE